MTATEQALSQKLCPAVKEKNLIKFWYEDDDSTKNDWRTVEPHLIGIHKSTGNALLTAWFLPDSEQKSKGWKEEWKTFKLLNISKEKILSQKYIKTRKDYNPKDSRMSQILCSTEVVL